jgi:hypothetical protein
MEIAYFVLPQDNRKTYEDICDYTGLLVVFKVTLKYFHTSQQQKLLSSD